MRACHARACTSVRARMHSRTCGPPRTGCPSRSPRCARWRLRAAAPSSRGHSASRRPVALRPVHRSRVHLPAALCSMVQRGLVRRGGTVACSAHLLLSLSAATAATAPLLLAGGATLCDAVRMGMRVRGEVIPRRCARMRLVCASGLKGSDTVDECEGSSAARGALFGALPRCRPVCFPCRACVCGPRRRGVVVPCVHAGVVHLRWQQHVRLRPSRGLLWAAVSLSGLTVVAGAVTGHVCACDVRDRVSIGAASYSPAPSTSARAVAASRALTAARAIFTSSLALPACCARCAAGAARVR